MPGAYHVLFICTGNCCRSQMAEALLKHLGGERFRAFSAGTDPAGFIHHLVLETMQRMEIPVRNQRSKSWHEVDSDHFDIVITVCDHAAGQACPVFPGHPVTAHWGLPDPSFHPGGEEERLSFALEVAGTLRRWIEKLIALPIEELTDEQLVAALQRIPQG